ncbi:aspartyl/glutamyl-tRNA amidotransferase subunit C [Patescibacteria group bacterium]|nr:aspartyl/glutamyl-tRNA amidotransferase subunit C [Patescibacteria group bacterium]MBU1500497.1 aspartyl/glutamyl-tRNA amidotransferase subunit C [Patescibacteria group bacterium]MBU2080704.1 aspartyl/glutamyl-tRNA amidotransferase subunit C [Patescibacteria group bacterium]MBU2123809.1 aspartyl/glutamyl-tRNA amidotransferase subunit C [Patescibacteria group bacterium]MBU2194900.1 aspartyl/glutamyl-tRNA amidotransferase subunit C [Patescibacteria group bacterium]
MSESRTSAEDVQRLAALARIQVNESDLEGFATEFESILAYVGKLDELSLPDTEKRVPELRNVFREDGEPFVPGTWTEKIVGQFPEKEGDSLSVKQIIAHD